MLQVREEEGQEGESGGRGREVDGEEERERTVILDGVCLHLPSPDPPPISTRALAGPWPSRPWT